MAVTLLNAKAPPEVDLRAAPAGKVTIDAGALVVGVVGLGYVGLPLALAFGRRVKTVGYDLSTAKIESYRRFVDPSGELTAQELREAHLLTYSATPTELEKADVVIVTAPTPVDDARLPDFGPLRSACQAVGQNLRQGAIVVFESTVYPGATEEVCIPEIERASGRKWQRNFFVGYSPERVNPGDKDHTLARIVKIVAADSEATLETIAALYSMIVPAGVHRVSSIRVAEAAKVIENTQRDLNIALMNELALIFHKMGLDTLEVLEAAGTKWNFLPFRPGLVGGHCIGVDPYYLTHQAEKFGHHPEVILAGRRINDNMGKFVAEQTIKRLVARGRPVNGSRVGVLGVTFKENCTDHRNSKVIDIARELQAYGANVRIHDPRANGSAVLAEYGVSLVPWEALENLDALVLAVRHREYTEMPLDTLTKGVRPGGCVIDIKGALDPQAVRARGLDLWRL